MNKYKIGDLFNIEKGSLQSSKNTPGMYDFITASAEWKTHESYTHDCEALVFAMGASGSLGRTHYVNGKFIASDLCFILTPKNEYKEKLNLKLYYFYFNYHRKEIVKNTATGTSKLAINMRNFSNYEIDFVDNQEQLVSIIESHQLKVEELSKIVIENEKLIKNLKNKLLEEAVQGKLLPQNNTDEPAKKILEDVKVEKEKMIKEKKIKKQKKLLPIKSEEIPFPIPENWLWVKLDDLCYYIQRGKSPKYSDIGRIPVISQKCIQWDGLDISKARFIDPDSVSTYAPERFLKNGDLLWNSTGLGTLGRINVFNANDINYKDVVVDSHVTVIRPFTDYVVPKYLLYWFSSPFVQNEINEKATGSTKQTELNVDTIKNYLVPLPPFKEQQRIVEKVDSILQYLSNLTSYTTEMQNLIDKLMKNIIENLFKSSQGK